MKIHKTAQGKTSLKMSKKEWEEIGQKYGWNKSAQMMFRMEYLTLGPTPSGEECAQVGQDNYYDLTKIETRAYINQLKRMFPNLLPSMRFVAKSFPHDFGKYHEVVVKYPENDEEAESMAYDIENNTPENWDNEARNELQNAGYFENLKPTTTPKEEDQTPY